MINPTFLDKIAQVLIADYSNNLTSTIVVLPNKRAKIFLIEALKKQVQNNILSPEIISIEDFIQEALDWYINLTNPIETDRFIYNPLIMDNDNEFFGCFTSGPATIYDANKTEKKKLIEQEDKSEISKLYNLSVSRR